MAITRAQQVKQLLPGLHALFGLEYKRYPEEWKDIFQVQTSDRSYEEETKLYGFGAANVTREGESVSFDTAGEAWTARYTHEKITMAFAITEEAVEDNLYESLSKRYTKAMARSFAYTKNVKGAAVLNNAFTAGFVGGDGVVLCSTAHPLRSAATQANRPVTGADLNETSLEAALISLSRWVDERGLLLATKGKKLILPPDLDFVATRLLQSQLRSSVQASAATFAPNDVNAIYQNSSIPGGYSINHFLTNPRAWFLVTDIQDGDGLKHFVRVRMSTKDDVDFATGNTMMKGRERYSFGWSDPFAIYGSPGA